MCVKTLRNLRYTGLHVHTNLSTLTARYNSFHAARRQCVSHTCTKQTSRKISTHVGGCRGVPMTSVRELKICRAAWRWCSEAAALSWCSHSSRPGHSLLGTVSLQATPHQLHLSEQDSQSVSHSPAGKHQSSYILSNQDKYSFDEIECSWEQPGEVCVYYFSPWCMLW